MWKRYPTQIRLRTRGRELSESLQSETIGYGDRRKGELGHRGFLHPTNVLPSTHLACNYAKWKRSHQPPSFSGRGKKVKGDEVLSDLDFHLILRRRRDCGINPKTLEITLPIVEHVARSQRWCQSRDSSWKETDLLLQKDNKGEFAGAFPARYWFKNGKRAWETGKRDPAPYLRLLSGKKWEAGVEV